MSPQNRSVAGKAPAEVWGQQWERNSPKCVPDIGPGPGRLADPLSSQPRASVRFPEPLTRPGDCPPATLLPSFQRPELQPAARVPRGHPDAGPPAGTVSSSVGFGVSSVPKGPPHPHLLRSRPPRSAVTGLAAGLQASLGLSHPQSWALPAWGEQGPAPPVRLAWHPPVLAGCVQRCKGTRAGGWPVPWGPSSVPCPSGAARNCLWPTPRRPLLVLF